MQVASKDRLNAHLKAYQQEHLLAFWSDLESESQDQLARQLDAIDFQAVPEPLTLALLLTEASDGAGLAQPRGFRPSSSSTD